MEFPIDMENAIRIVRKNGNKDVVKKLNSLQLIQNGGDFTRGEMA
jgi:hypothetical protein